MNTDHVDVGADYADTQVAEIFLHHRVLVVPVVDGRARGGRADARRVLPGHRRGVRRRVKERLEPIREFLHDEAAGAVALLAAALVALVWANSPASDAYGGCGRRSSARASSTSTCGTGSTTG